MAADEPIEICCLLEDNVNYSFPRVALCRAMREIAGESARIQEYESELGAAPERGYLVVEAPFEAAVDHLSAHQLRRTFLLDGAKGPALYRCLEAHSMPGGFQTEEWFKVRDLDTVRYPILRIEVAEGLGFERLLRHETEHYAQYNPGIGLAALLVRYLSAYHSRAGAP